MLEIVKAMASVATPLVVAYFGFVLNSRLKEIEHKRQDEKELEHLIYEEEKERIADEKRQKKDELERTYKEIIELDLDGEFVGYQNGFHVLSTYINIHNKGKILKNIKSLKVRIRGVKGGSELSSMKGGGRLEFPEKISDENVLSKNWIHMFIEPGVVQKISYTTKIDEQYSFILVYAQFKYSDIGSHSFERVFEIPSNKRN